MKILFVSDAKSIHTKRWALSMKEKGHDVHVASFRDESIPGVTVHLLPRFGLGKLGYFFAVPVLRKIQRTFKPDVVHAQYITSYGFVAALAKTRPLILTAWGTDLLISPSKSRIMRIFVEYAFKKADFVTTVAQHMNAAALVLGVHSNKIEAIPFGVDTSFFKPSSRKLAVPAKFKLISTRNFTPVYSVDTLIEALHLLKDRGVILETSLIGQGPCKEELQTLITKYGLEDSVTFKGHVDHKTLATLIAESDLFVTSSLSDGNNISLNEAMAAGTFPIASQIPANEQWLEHGKNGYLFKVKDAGALADCIQLAMGDSEFRQKAIGMNLDLVREKADWSNAVQRMIEIYGRAINDFNK